MHICTVVPSYLPNFGGAEVGMHQILSNLSHTTSHRYTVIAATTNQSLPKHEILDDVEVFRYTRPQLWAKWFAPTLVAFHHVRQILEELKPDLVHASYILPTGLSAYYAARELGTPFITTLGGNDIYDPFNIPPWILRRWVKGVLKNVHTISAFSVQSKETLIKEYQIPPDKVHITGFGVNTTRFHPSVSGKEIRCLYGLTDEQPVIIALQRLEARKGVDVLIHAMRLVCDLIPNAHMLIAGKGRDRDRLEQLIDKLSLRKNITLCGFISEEDKPAFYAAGDVFTLHSHFEGLGIVILEASATGLPVISTDAGGTRDVVRQGKTGYLLPIGNAIAFAEHIRLILSDSQQLRLMGQAAREFVVREFDENVVAKRFQNLFEEAFQNYPIQP